MIHEHNVGATFDRGNMLQSKISREGSIGQDRQHGLFQFPLVILFPGNTKLFGSSKCIY